MLPPPRVQQHRENGISTERERERERKIVASVNLLPSSVAAEVDKLMVETYLEVCLFYITLNQHLGWTNFQFHGAFL